MTLKNFLLIILVLTLYYLGLSHTVDPDLWWHLKTGEWTLAKGLPMQDVFSYTQAGTDWVQHKWLFQVLLWLGYLWGGLWPLMIVCAGLLALTGYFIYLRSDGGPFIAVLMALLAGGAMEWIWGVRSQVVTAVFFSAYFLILEKVKRKEWPMNRLLWVPFLMLFWANLHGGYLVGIALVAVFWAAELFEFYALKKKESSLARVFFWTGLACFCVSLIHPNGFSLLTNSLATMLSPVQRNFIMEWHSINFHDALSLPVMTLLLMLVFSLAIKKRSMPVYEILICLGTLYLTLTSVRHIYYFAIAIPPFISRNLTSYGAARDWEGSFLKRSFDRPITLGRKIMQGAVLGVAFSACFVLTQSYGYLVTDRAVFDYPHGAVWHLKKNHLEKRHLFNSYAWGGYLIFNNIPVFIDGRADMYGDEFFKEYLRIESLNFGWEALLKKYKIDLILFPLNSELSRVLRSNKNWKVAFEDEISIIFQRAD